MFCFSAEDVDIWKNGLDDPCAIKVECDDGVVVNEACDNSGTVLPGPMSVVARDGNTESAMDVQSVKTGIYFVF